jgi:hypothetical protein
VVRFRIHDLGSEFRDLGYRFRVQPLWFKLTGLRINGLRVKDLKIMDYSYKSYGCMCYDFTRFRV